MSLSLTRHERMDVDEVRTLCIRCDFYTRGDCLQYEKMFGMVRKYTGNVSDLLAIASDIYYHSDIDRVIEITGYEGNTGIVHLMNLIDERCIIRWYEYEEVE